VKGKNYGQKGMKPARKDKLCKDLIFVTVPDNESFMTCI